MNAWQQLEVGRKIALLESISNTTGLSPQAIEKDWWVTMVLYAVFQSSCASHAVFKGGTSLSKGWRLVERLSEDVDIAIDRSFFNMNGELSRKEINQLRRLSCAYIRDSLSVEIQKNLFEMGVEDFTIIVPPSTDSTVDPQTLEIHYHSIFDSSDYLKSKVLLEVGSRSSIEPNELRPIKTIIAENYPDSVLDTPAMSIPTVTPVKTFLEKLFLLHEEFSKPISAIRTLRMTRHLYDVTHHEYPLC